MGHLVNVSLPTTICLTLVYSSTVRAKLFLPLHRSHLAQHSFRHEVWEAERNTLQQLVGRKGHGELPLAAGWVWGEQEDKSTVGCEFVRGSPNITTAPCAHQHMDSSLCHSPAQLNQEG